MAVLLSVSYSGTWGHQSLPREPFIDKAAELGSVEKLDRYARHFVEFIGARTPECVSA